jgi:hypothetical protein
MQNSYSKLWFKHCAMVMVYCSFQMSIVHASENFWSTVTIFGCIGSVASLAYSIPTTNVARAGLDAACVTAAISDFISDDYLNYFTGALNLGCLVGSAYSLLLWTPIIMHNVYNPLYVARALIDITQISLVGKRLYSTYQDL